ncbi:MAG: lanthionine synthetase LanC family protein [Pseudomonadales bacterium]
MPSTDTTKWTPSRSLAIANGVDRWLQAHQRPTANGLAWGRAAEDPERIVRTLYTGSAGIAIFLLELHKATGAQEPLAAASACGNDLISYLQSKDQLPCAMFTGWAGYAFVFTELFKATGSSDFSDAAARCLNKLADQSSALGSGRGWIEPMPFSDITGFTGDREIYDASVGAAGAGMVYLYALEQGVYPAGLTIATAIGDRLLEVAEPMQVGLQWRLMDDMPFEFSAPNFAHGGAGVAYYLARLYQHTNDQRHLDAAIAGAAHLQDIAFRKGSGKLVCHLKEGRNPNAQFYLGQCHGPAGTSRLFYLLHQITGEKSYEEFSTSLMRGLEATGAPEERSYGMWNNISQCCCDAGIGDYALFMYQATQDNAYLQLALRVADELEQRATQDETGYRWTQAEHRARPDFVETQTGYMQGAAGVGSFFVHLASVLGDFDAKIVFADCPYGSAATAELARNAQT